MDHLIPLVNKLQDAFASVGLSGVELPQIAVIGSQSSGKSSVLESIVGKDFLPRGSGIVTRRPLVLQLNHTPSKAGQEYGVFLHDSHQKHFHDFGEIRREIQSETDRSTGTNKGISSQPIHLKIYSPNVLNLTLIDLPGVTKVAVGDQPADIESQIRNMIMRYIEKESCLILAVSPANSDIANSDALQLSKLVDPDGQRTIGVLTKLDLMDEGTDAFDILTNKTYPLKNGFVGVVNRSQKEIDSMKNVQSALEKEQDWFAKHPTYSPIQSKCGTKYLQEKLKQTLIQHIATHMPQLKHRLVSRMKTLEREVDALNAPFKHVRPVLLTDKRSSVMAPWDRSQVNGIILNIVRAFSGALKGLIDGHDGDIVSDIFDLAALVSGPSGEGQSRVELNGMVRIKLIFHEIFPQTLKSVESVLLSSCMDDEIRAVIHNARGLRAGLFVPDALFELLIKRQIAQLELPALDCVDIVYDELIKMIKAVLESPNSPVRAFPRLLSWMLSESMSLLDACRGPAKDEVKRLIQMELGYINTGHPDFIGNKGIATFLSREKARRKNGVKTVSKRPGGLILGSKQGSLSKLGGTRRTWKRRFFNVKDGVVSFFENEGDKAAKGSFPLRNCLVRDLDSGEIFPLNADTGDFPPDSSAPGEDGSYFKGREHLFEVFSRDGKLMFRNHARLYLQAETAEEKNEWIQVLVRSILFSRSDDSQSGTDTDESIDYKKGGKRTPPPTPRRPPVPIKPSKPASLRTPMSPPVSPVGSKSGSTPTITTYLPRLPDQMYASDLPQSKSRPFARPLSPEQVAEDGSDSEGNSMTAGDEVTISLIRSLMHSYFVIVRKHVQDLVPKAVIFLMISKMKRDLAPVMTNKILSGNAENECLLDESPEIQGDRLVKTEMLRMIRSALDVMEKEVRSELMQL